MEKIDNNECLDQDKMKKIREYIVTKYGANYLFAIGKIFVCDLFTKEAYDENGILKPEYTLTSKEKEALMLYIPELASVLSETKEESNDFDQRYQKFLNDVKNNTIEVVDNQEPEKAKGTVLWEVVGIEFLSWEVEKKYGKDIYQKACEEVPYEDDGVHRMFKRDFSKAQVKLGHLIHEGVSASPLMDLNLFIELLEKKGIPSYIDYEKNIYYFNAQPEVDKKEEQKGAILTYKV